MARVGFTLRGKMREDEELLKIGKHEIDVSNISLDKKMKAGKMWSHANGIKCHRDGSPLKDESGNVERYQRNLTELQFQKEILLIFLYLIRQEMIVLKRKFTFKDAIKQYILRAFISYRYLKTLSSEDVEEFVCWTFEKLTGEKKKTKILMSGMMTE